MGPVPVLGQGSFGKDEILKCARLLNQGDQAGQKEMLIMPFSAILQPSYPDVALSRKF